MLTYKGLDAWLEDRDGRVIKHTEEVIDNNKITAVVHIEPKSLYTFRWRRSPGAQPTSAWCQIFNSLTVHGAAIRVAHTSMDETKNATQSRTSKGVLEMPLKRYGRLRVPVGDQGSVWLEIRRTRGPPIERDLIDLEDPEGETIKCEVEMDLLDDPAENKPPWVIFQFNFKNPTEGMDSSSSGSEDDKETLDSMDVHAPRQLRKDPLQVKKNFMGPSDPLHRQGTNSRMTKISRPRPPTKRQRTSSSQSSADTDIQTQFEALNEEERRLEKALANKLQAKRKRVETLRRLLDND